MGVTIRSVDNTTRVTRALQDVGRNEIQVGIFDGGDIGMIAAVHEYGAQIPVTEKMRGWFGANGFPLKASTTVITIPERSFIRGGFDEHSDKVINKIENLLPRVIALQMDPDAFLDAIGVEFASLLKKYMNELDSPPNSGMTVAMKGSSNPLVDSGRLRNSITHKVI